MGPVWAWILRQAQDLVHKLDAFTDQQRATQATTRAAIWQLYADLKAYRAEGRQVPPVIMVTANDLPGDREMYLQLGAQGYIAKPVDLDQLRLEMQRVLGPR